MKSKAWLLIILCSIFILSGCDEYYTESDMEDYLADNASDYVRKHLFVDEAFDEDKILTYVRENYSLNEVFDDYYIQEFVGENYDMDTVYSEDDILEYVADNYTPEEVFPPEYYDYESE